MGIGQGAVESMGVNRGFWSGRRVFVTGHTGFKGAWAVNWLARMGAKVTGYALAPETTPNLWALTGPAGVTSVTIEVAGAQGGDGWNTSGGLGGYMAGDFTVVCHEAHIVNSVHHPRLRLNREE